MAYGFNYPGLRQWVEGHVDGGARTNHYRAQLWRGALQRAILPRSMVSVRFRNTTRGHIT